jgi:hypothetical protein
MKVKQRKPARSETVMRSFKIGDHVCVSRSVSSDYAGSTGIVVAVEQREAGPTAAMEYVVEFNGVFRRNFLGFHLTDRLEVRNSADVHQFD